MITPPPPRPSRSDTEEDFDSKMNAYLAWQAENVDELNAALAALGVGVTEWISGTVYDEGALTWSPIDKQTYRRLDDGGGVTDPSADTGHWVSIGAQTILSKSVAGTGDVALTVPEQRRGILIFTGVLTGNRNVTVDTTQWEWTVVNNTTGAYTLTLKTTAGTGKSITQGKATKLRCDGTNVVDAITALTSLSLSGNFLNSAQPAFHAVRNSDVANVTGDSTDYTVICDNEVFDQGANYNNATGVFTAPVTGRYHFGMGIEMGNLGGAHISAYCWLNTSNRPVFWSKSNAGAARTGPGSYTVSGSVTIDMDAGDTAEMHLQVHSGTKVVSLDAYSYFSGHLVC